MIGNIPDSFSKLLVLVTASVLFFSLLEVVKTFDEIDATSTEIYNLKESLRENNVKDSAIIFQTNTKIKALNRKGEQKAARSNFFAIWCACVGIYFGYALYLVYLDEKRKVPHIG